ncbi:dihydrofolate reductase family protein [Demequina sp. NBRC 110056]|uniref:dihydrofolate reductase family protein n=1 Tax=Demequina sp. NBRC 110056 TaxID=1570345 RepID=UPI000A01A982|nr:dihydrofolate reductase family protein [Demequina sp. NBRC 110056]
MGRLIYSAIMSADGYIADATGDFGWAEPSVDAHLAINEVARPVGTYVLGRRTHEVMAVWDELDTPENEGPMREFAQVWAGADKVVVSSTLEAVSTRRTTLRGDLDLDWLRALTADADRDVAIAGPTLAAPAIRAGLVDELQLWIVPAIVGGGLAALPEGARADYTLAETREVGGFVFLRLSATR